ncbi:uncharacterized protein FPRO_03619 [Fusarium proliferatum ET1]|uniref:Uncharacterized protein n=1 Tax=Fusarium proliferatum (strain ET1) TaxID=1227346 RepID=A0A1L7V5J0_FUSPR|nr:uncharacterized protein FPRO_03619 [Fusarium proliferatum ET1]CZR36121.1 uncharacterized protein FPRO_03619 [Fusarium proliferatum ET1]
MFTASLPTTQGMTAEIATTTANIGSEVPSDIPFISNARFDECDSSIAPWELYTGENTAFVVSDVTHTGSNSAFMIQGQSPLIDFIKQPLKGSLTAGVMYHARLGQCKLLLPRCCAHMLISKITIGRNQSLSFLPRV